jgi:hypothetical protein
MLIDNNWRNIAWGHDALLILGGESGRDYDQEKLKQLKEKYFTVTANMMIKSHPDIDMYITADNVIVKQMFEEYPYITIKHQEAFVNNNQLINIVAGAELSIPDNTMMKQDFIKVIFCQNIATFNNVFATGQLHLEFLKKYHDQYKNVFGCLEHRILSQNGITKELFGYEGRIIKSTDEDLKRYYGNLIEKTKYGEVFMVYAGGNVSADILQLLYFMGFERVIVIGYGDEGKTLGYEDNRNFQWSEVEIDSMKCHSLMWKNRIRILNGGELLMKYGNFTTISFEELMEKSQNKQELIKKIIT